jgi:ketosteroid isomerase-like protein
MKTLKTITKKGMILSLVLATGLAGSAVASAQNSTSNPEAQAVIADSTLNFSKVELNGPRQLSKQNAKLIQDFYGAFLRGDMEAVTKYISGDFIMHVPGKGLNAGEYWGADGLKKFASNIFAYNGGTFNMKVPTLAVSGDTAFTQEIIQLNRKQDPKRMFELRFTMQYSIKNGKVSEAWTIPDDLYAYDDYWTPPVTGAANSTTLTPTKDNGSLNQPGPSTKGAVSKENYDLVKDLYNDFWEGNLEGVKAKFADNLELTVAGKNPIAGTYHGWEGFIKFRTNLMNLGADKYKLEINTMAAGRNDVFVKEYIRMNRKWDPTPQVVPAVIMHFHIENGKITKIRDIAVDQLAYDVFFSPPTK